jgi:hypothetical protein
MKIIIDTNLIGLLMPIHFNSEQVMKIGGPLLYFVFDDGLHYEISIQWPDFLLTQVF